MKILIFGSTGMIGQGALRECLLDTGVSRVVTIVRKPSGQSHARLTEVVVPDLASFSPAQHGLQGFDACFFAIGVTAAGLSEDAYSKVTLDIPVAVAKALLPHNPAMTFVFVSGKGADGTGSGRVMWARVKGRAEMALLQMAFQAVYVLRPGLVRPLHGARSRTAWYRVFYAALAWLLPMLQRVYPNGITTTEQIGRAVLRLAREGYGRQVLESRDINSL